MAILQGTLDRLGLWLTAAPDEVLADAAREGELIVARVRTWLTLLLTLIPLLSLAVEPDVLGPRWTPREGGSGPRYRLM